MRNTLWLSLLISILAFFTSYSQYTESINTYRPGTSQGAFTVGRKVFQIESGLSLSNQSHSIFNNKTRNIDFQYFLRLGLFFEQLELSLNGNFLNQKITEPVGNTDESYVRSGFYRNIVGAKFLFFDPYKYYLNSKVDIRSWDANHKFTLRKLVPALSLYAGAGFRSSTGDHAFQNNSDNRATQDQPTVSPRFTLIAQNNFTEQLVLVNNFMYDFANTEFPDFRYIITLTYNFKGRYAVLGEYEAALSKIYRDNIFRLGGTFLLNNDLQFDISATKNIKNSPSLLGFNFGLSYRFDKHTTADDQKILTEKMYDVKKVAKQIKKDIKKGFVDENTLTGKYRGVDLEDYADEEEEDTLLEENGIPEKKKWHQKLFDKFKFGKKKKEKEALAQETEEDAVTLGTGNMTDFADEEFLMEKRESIRPKERTPEEQAAFDALNAAKYEKKNKRIKEPLIDPLTGEPFTNEELASMSKKEIKKLRKEQEILNTLDNELLNLQDQIDTEQSARDIAKEQKRKEKEARKKAKKQAEIDYLKSQGIEVPEEMLEPEKPSKAELKRQKKLEKEKSKQNREELELQKEIEALEKEQLKEEKRLKAFEEVESRNKQKKEAKKEALNAKREQELAKEQAKQDALNAKRDQELAKEQAKQDALNAKREQELAKEQARQDALNAKREQELAKEQARQDALNAKREQELAKEQARQEAAQAKIEKEREKAQKEEDKYFEEIEVKTSKKKKEKKKKVKEEEPASSDGLNW